MSTTESDDGSGAAASRSKVVFAVAIVAAVAVIVAAVLIVRSRNQGTAGPTLPSPQTAPPLTGGACTDPTGDVSFDEKNPPPAGVDLTGIDLTRAEAKLNGNTLDVSITTAGPIDAGQGPTFFIDQGPAGQPQSFELRAEPVQAVTGAPWQVTLITFKTGTERRSSPLKTDVKVDGNTVSFKLAKEDIPSLTALIWLFGATVGEADNAPSDDCDNFSTPKPGGSATQLPATSAPPTTAAPISFGTMQVYKPTGSQVTVFGAQTPPADPTAVKVPADSLQQPALVEAQVCAGDKRVSTEVAFFQIKDDQNHYYLVWNVPAEDVAQAFPTKTVLEPGDCARGFVPFQVPEGTRIASVIYSPAANGENFLSWKA